MNYLAVLSQGTIGGNFTQNDDPRTVTAYVSPPLFMG
jgi:hypothetical protein